MTRSLPAGYFDELYARHPDPWRLAERWYEQRKYALTMAALPARRYRSAFEPGCSVGVLTALLATRCDRLLATDVSPVAVQAARRRVAGLPHVTVRRLAVPVDWPHRDGDRSRSGEQGSPFDLVVLSELGYYFGPHDLRDTLDAAVRSLEPGGDLVAAHWRHPVADYPLRGDEVHAALAAHPHLHRTVAHREEDFLLEVFTRTGPGHPTGRSVARRSGLC